MTRPGWQEIGWNGIAMQLPAAWHPTVVLPAYLFFEDEEGPVCEIKWQQVRGRFSAAHALRRLQKSAGRDARVSEWELPANLYSCLPAATVAGFTLEEGESRSYGFLVFSPHRNQVTLLRFYFDPAGDLDLVGTLLASLELQSGRKSQLWSIFDIRVVLPGAAKLRSHEFLPGRFTLVFEIKGSTVTLTRFRPAAALLGKKSLADFGTALGGQGTVLAEGTDTVYFVHLAAGIDRLRARLRRRPVWRWFRLQHLPGHNVILGLQGEGGKADEALLEQVSSGFTIKEAN